MTFSKRRRLLSTPVEVIRQHRTKTGQVMLVSDMDDKHLMNTIAMIRRKAEEGIAVICGGRGSSAEDMWADETFYKGNEALDEMGYSNYTAEALRRGLPL